MQDDLHIVDSLDLPTDDPKYLEKLVEERGWGPAVLFIDEYKFLPYKSGLNIIHIFYSIYSTDYMPLNITAASDPYGQYKLMPVYGNTILYSVDVIWSCIITDSVYCIKRIERVQHVETSHASSYSGGGRENRRTFALSSAP